MIYEVLREGKENALTTNELVRYFNFDDKRDLTLAIYGERCDGKVILSTGGNGGGYYKPANEAEIREFVKTMDGRVRAILKATQSARNALKQEESME